MVAYDIRDEAEASVGGIDAHVVGTVKQELEGVDEDHRVVDVAGLHALLEGGITVAYIASQRTLDEPEGVVDELLAAIPSLDDGGSHHGAKEFLGVDAFRADVVETIADLAMRASVSGIHVKIDSGLLPR